MSDAAEKVKKPRRRNPPKKAAAEGDAPRTPRAPATPVPENLVGTTAFGRVSDVMNRGRERFGFIYITPTDNYVAPAEEGKSGLALYSSLPRIYFNGVEWKEGADTKARKNDIVTFKIVKDAKDRPYASEMTLTAAGKAAAAARDAAFAEAQKNAPAKAPKAEGAEKPKRERKERPKDERTVALSLTCEGFPGQSKEIVACLGESLGKLKHTGITAFGGGGETDPTLIEFKVYYKGEALTKATLTTLSPGETIHLQAPKA